MVVVVLLMPLLLWWPRHIFAFDYLTLKPLYTTYYHACLVVLLLLLCAVVNTVLYILTTTFLSSYQYHTFFVNLLFHPPDDCFDADISTNIHNDNLPMRTDVYYLVFDFLIHKHMPYLPPVLITYSICFLHNYLCRPFF